MSIRATSISLNLIRVAHDCVPLAQSTEQGVPTSAIERKLATVAAPGKAARL